jgi:conjugal transfer pilus assembly protein TraK
MPSRQVKKSRALSLSLGLILLFAGLAGAEEPAAAEKPAAESAGASVEVPEAIMAALNQVNQGGKRPRRSARVEAAQGGVIKVSPGRNVTLTVAGDQLNRIVTPFTNPLVHTVSKAKISVDGSVVYVSLAQEDGPATMFITENGESDPSISLTLTPAMAPPREVRLELSGGGPVVSVSARKSARWEKSQPYTEAIEKVMLSTARGEVPPGYNLRDFIARDPAPRCRLPVKVEPRQVLEGHNFLVVVSRLTNLSSQQLMMAESACYQEGVRAVAVWPKVSLGPRQSTELYVVYQREMGQKPGKRPSVLHPRPAGPVCDSEPDPKPRSRPGSLAVSEAAQSPRILSAHLP